MIKSPEPIRNQGTDTQPSGLFLEQAGGLRTDPNWKIAHKVAIRPGTSTFATLASKKHLPDTGILLILPPLLTPTIRLIPQNEACCLF